MLGDSRSQKGGPRDYHSTRELCSLKGVYQELVDTLRGPSAAAAHPQLLWPCPRQLWSECEGGKRPAVPLCFGTVSLLTVTATP